MPFAHLDLSKALFIDIETVPEQRAFADLEPEWQKLWQEKWNKTRTQRYKHVFDDAIEAHISQAQLTAEAATAYKEAGLYAEFGKICCISIGQFKEYKQRPGQRHFLLQSFYGQQEGVLLSTFSKGIKGKTEMTTAGRGTRFAWSLVGHNIKEFDVPYLCRRLLVLGQELPPMLDIAGLKPWEVMHMVDTMELWKFGDFKNFTPLALLAKLFTIPSPKATMDGSQVGDYYLQGDLPAIAHYCAQDVLTLAQLVLRWRGEDILQEDEVETVLKSLD